MTLTTKAISQNLSDLIDRLIPADQQQPLYLLLNCKDANSLQESLYCYIKKSNSKEYQKLTNLIIDLIYLKDISSI